jgi:hypothetical protein
MTYWNAKRRPALIVPIAAKEKGTGGGGFPAVPFETAVLSRLVEVKAADVLADGGPLREAEAVAGRLKQVESLIGAWTLKMDDERIINTVAKKLGDLSAEREALREKREQLRRSAAGLSAESWGEFQTLADLMRDDPSDELRVKVRAALRRNVEAVYCLFLNRGRTAAVQVWFTSGAHRDYVIVHRPAKGGVVTRPARTECKTFAAGAGLDLRQPQAAARLAAVLAGLNPAALADG